MHPLRTLYFWDRLYMLNGAVISLTYGEITLKNPLDIVRAVPDTTHLINYWPTSDQTAPHTRVFCKIVSVRINSDPRLNL